MRCLWLDMADRVRAQKPVNTKRQTVWRPVCAFCLWVINWLMIDVSELVQHPEHAEAIFGQSEEMDRVQTPASIWSNATLQVSHLSFLLRKGLAGIGQPDPWDWKWNRMAFKGPKLYSWNLFNSCSRTWLYPEALFRSVPITNYSRHSDLERREMYYFPISSSGIQKSKVSITFWESRHQRGLTTCGIFKKYLVLLFHFLQVALGMSTLWNYSIRSLASTWLSCLPLPHAHLQGHLSFNVETTQLAIISPFHGPELIVSLQIPFPHKRPLAISGL